MTSLSIFAATPREKHLVWARKIFGYLKKYPKRGYVVSARPLKHDVISTEQEIVHDSGNQYTYFHEDIDPRFPDPVVEGLAVMIFSDSDHGHDKVTGRSITGILVFLGSTPIYWSSKRQSSVQLSTYGAEFIALNTGVQMAEEVRYHLRAMGVKVDAPTVIYEDNQSVCMSAADPGSTLNKKCVALSYHYVREHIANKVVTVRKVGSEHNYADPFTKGMYSVKHGEFFYNFLSN